jgi:folylpolyglutamate synthase/dihydropteroate synthase
MADEQIHTITTLQAPRVDALNVITDRIHVVKLEIENYESKSLTSASHRLSWRSPCFLMLDVFFPILKLHSFSNCYLMLVTMQSGAQKYKHPKYPI